MDILFESGGEMGHNLDVDNGSEASPILPFAPDNFGLIHFTALARNQPIFYVVIMIVGEVGWH